VTIARPTRPAPAIRRRLVDSRQPSQPRCLVRLLGLVVTLSVGLLLAPLDAEAQPAAKVFRIGLLGSSSPSDLTHLGGILPRAAGTGVCRGPKHPDRGPILRGADRTPPRPRGRAGSAKSGRHRRAGPPRP